jgi:N-methylhydantoinase A
MHLDAPAAGRALALLGARLGYMDADAAPRAAEAALRVATAKMATEVRGGFARRGLDPRDFALIAYGGAGPTHGALLAHEVGMAEMLVPLSPGTLCALGAVASELRRDFVRTIRKPVGAASTSDLQRAVASIRTESSGWLADERHLFGASIATHWTAEMRYPQEGIGLVVGLASEVLETGDAGAMASAFHAEHERVYGFRDTSGGVELLSLHAQVVGGEPGSLVADPDGASTGNAETGARRVFTGGTWRTVAVHQRHALTAGTRITGPALIEQEDTTVWVLPGWLGVSESGGIIRVRSAKP